jgi:hypothetical protein
VARAGCGLIDSLGRPKAPWYTVSRVFAHRTMLLTGEGLSGLQLHVLNDRPTPLMGTLRLTGPARPLLGLEVALGWSDGDWALELSSRLFAQHVALDLPGFVPSDSRLHLAPGRPKTVMLSPAGPADSPVGTVRAFNAISTVRVAENATIA